MRLYVFEASLLQRCIGADIEGIGLAKQALLWAQWKLQVQ
jgi:hypothetical protein